eukprot:g1016.t1
MVKRNIIPHVDCIRTITLNPKSYKMQKALQEAEILGFFDDRYKIQVEERDIKNGRRGCWNAHKKAAKLGLENGCKNQLVFEDDVYFSLDVLHGFQTLNSFLESTESTTPAWDFIFLGQIPLGLSPPLKSKTKDGVRSEKKPQAMNSYSRYRVVHAQMPLLTHAYVMSKSMMEKFVREAEFQQVSEREIDENIDQWIGNYSSTNGNSFAIQPMFAFQRQLIGSGEKSRSKDMEFVRAYSCPVL